MKYTLIKTLKGNELVNLVNKAKDIIIVEGGNDKINRIAVENKKVDILLSPEKGREREHTHYRNSGLNQVLCKLAKKNNVAIGLDFNEVVEAKDKYKIMARMMQNIRLCRKYKVRMIILDLKERVKKEELKSFGLTLGMTPGEAKKAVSFKY